MKFAKFWFLLTYALFPFYLLPSGGFQMSSATMLLMFLTMVLSPKIRFRITGTILLYAAFVSYTILVNLIWFVLTSDRDFIQYVVINLFTLFGFACTANLARYFTEVDVRHLLYALLVIVVVQLLILVFELGRPGYRAIGFFNNPNQLGYFASLCAATAIVVSYQYRVRSFVVILITIGALVIAVYSLSKAAMAACIIYLCIVLMMSNSLSLKNKLIAALLVAAVAAGSAGFVMETEVYTHLEKRINGFSPDNDDSLAGRGYDRLTDYPEYLVFGAGEGYVERFNTHIELHSYPASVLFCYGVIGAGIMLLFLFNLLRDWRLVLFLMPLLIYNVSHNGGRVLLLWTLMGLLAVQVPARLRERTRQQNVTTPRRQRVTDRKSETGSENSHSGHLYRY